MRENLKFKILNVQNRDIKQPSPSSLLPSAHFMERDKNDTIREEDLYPAAASPCTAARRTCCQLMMTKYSTGGWNLKLKASSKGMYTNMQTVAVVVVICCIVCKDQLKIQIMMPRRILDRTFGSFIQVSFSVSVWKVHKTHLH